MKARIGVCGGNIEKIRSSKKFLVIVNVVGSTGPIRLVVKEDDLVTQVIESTLKTYAKEGRLPALGSDVANFTLYTASDQAASDAQALEAGEAIGRSGGRNFVLCKNVQRDSEEMMMATRREASSGWKAWFDKCFFTFNF